MAIKRKDIRDIVADEQMDMDAKVKKLLDMIHGETDELKDARDELQKQLDAANASLETAKTAKEKAEKDLTDYKNGQTAKETREAKEKAVREYFKEKGISTDASLNLAMGFSHSKIDEIELDEDGKIKDAKTLDALISGDLKSLVVSTETKGAETQTPPNGTPTKYKSRADIMKIKDTAERQKAISENPELFGFKT